MNASKTLILLVPLSGCLGMYPGSWEAWEQANSGADDTATGPIEPPAMEQVEATTFSMGSPTEEVGRSESENAHDVVLSGGFWLGTTEITQAEFLAVVGDLPSGQHACVDCPVVNVTWHQAAGYCNGLSAETGLDLCYECTGEGKGTDCVLEPTLDSPYDCTGYRLPTEAEWELGARGDTASAFNNGGNLYEGDDSDCEGSLQLDNGSMVDDIAVYCGNSGGVPSSVGSEAENSLGLFDMHGNVWEWVHDWYSEYTGSETDPWGPELATDRVFRSGSYNNPPRNLRAAARGRNTPDYDSETTGFRVAKSAD